MKPTSLILANASILDVAADLVRDPQDIVIENGRIRDIGSFLAAKSQLPRIDLHGRIAMPGLCDAHVHVTALSANLPSLRHFSPSYVAAGASVIMRDMLMRGFTTVRDAGGADFGLARAVEEGLIEGPRLLFCEKALSQTGGHADMRGAGENALFQCPCCAGIGHVCDGVSEMRRACRDIVRKGGTHIKLMVSGGIASPTDKLTSDQFADDEIGAAVEEARAAGIYCMAHAYTPRAMQRAVRAGVKSIEHGNLLDQETADVMLETGAYLVPTLVTYEALAREGGDSGLPPEMCDKIGEVLNAGVAALDIAVGTGLPIAYGSDLLGAMHRHQLRELELRRAVQNPIDILRGATVTAASLFDLENEVGAIVPGAQADILVLDNDPRSDLSVLQRPDEALRLIMTRGRIAKNTLDTD
jgi:imidazolonepropionase-like amidohydrolase